MMRCSPWLPLLVLCTFASPAAAAKIDVERGASSLNLLDPAFQEAVIAAAPVDWLESPGADVWWLSFEGMRVQVQVFPTLRRPGVGRPNCCLFEFGDAEFWLKVRGVFPTAGGPSGSESQPGAPIGEQLVIVGPQITDESSDTSSSTGGQNSGPGGTGSQDPGDSGHHGTLPSLIEDAALVGGSALDVVAAQVPEPSLLLLMGVGLAAAARRVRRT